MLAKLSVDQALMKANSFAKKGEIAEAEKIYKSILNTFSKNQRALKGLSSLGKFKRKDTPESLPQEIINELLQLYNQRQFSTVAEKAQVLTKQYADSFLLWNILGVSAGQIREFEKAIDAFKKSIVTSVAKLFGRKMKIEVWIGEGLPRSSNGKILKRILKNIIAGKEDKDWTISNFERVRLGGIKKNDLRGEGEK